MQSRIARKYRHFLHDQNCADRNAHAQRLLVHRAGSAVPCDSEGHPDPPSCSRARPSQSGFRASHGKTDPVLRR